MRLDNRALAIAAAVAALLGYTFCALVVALFPRAASSFFSYILHLDLTPLARPLSWGSFGAGVLAFAVALGSLAALVGRVYNHLVELRESLTP